MPVNRDKNELYPPFAEVLERFESKLADANLPFFMFEGFRTPERQLELFMQGRGRPGPIVTRAMPFSSYHHYGLAADYVLDGMLDRPGIQWSWDTKGTERKQQWLDMARLAKSCGLEPGYYWSSPDLPHVQMKFGYTVAEMRAKILEGQGVSDIWELLDQWRLTNA